MRTFLIWDFAAGHVVVNGSARVSSLAGGVPTASDTFTSKVQGAFQPLRFFVAILLDATQRAATAASEAAIRTAFSRNTFALSVGETLILGPIPAACCADALPAAMFIAAPAAASSDLGGRGMGISAGVQPTFDGQTGVRCQKGVDNSDTTDIAYTAFLEIEIVRPPVA